MASVEPARRDVDVLRLHFEPHASFRSSPRFHRAKERAAHSSAAHLGRDANVPQQGDVATSFEHADTRRIERYGRAAHTRAINACDEEAPAREIESRGPMDR